MNQNNVKLDEIIDFSKPIIYLDIEASNRKPWNPKIIQIAGIKVQNNQVIEKFNEWSNPEEIVEPRILKMVNRTQEFLKKKPKNFFVFRHFLKFIEGVENIVVFGNYDQMIINCQSRKFKTRQVKLIDIQKAFFDKIIESKTLSISLSALARALDVHNHAAGIHNALLDAEMLYEIVMQAKKSYLPDLKKKFCFSMIIPRPKEEKRSHDLFVDKVLVNLDHNYSINFIEQRVENETAISEETNKEEVVVKKAFFQVSNFNQAGKLNYKIKKEQKFEKGKFNEIHDFEKKAYEEFLECYDQNSIFVYERNIKNFEKCFFEKNQYWIRYYYIPNQMLLLYLKHFEKINTIDEFLNNKDAFKKTFDLIRREKKFFITQDK